MAGAHKPRKKALERLHELGPDPVVYSVNSGVNDPSRVVIVFEGVHAGVRGTSVTVRARDAEGLRLRAGSQLDEVTLEALRGCVRREMTRRAALASLQRSMCSRRRLTERLVRRGHDREVVRGVCEELVAAGILNEEAMAMSAARSMARKASGARLIEQKLRARGIDAGTAKRAATEATADRDPLEDAAELARKKLRGMSRDLERVVVVRRLSGALARRGFDADVCRRAVERVLGEQVESE